MQSSDSSSETSANALDLMVDRLVADLRPVESPPVARRLALGLGVGIVISLIFVGIVLGYRPDMASATMTMIFWVKLAYVSGIGAVADTMAARCGNACPESSSVRKWTGVVTSKRGSGISANTRATSAGKNGRDECTAA